MSRTFSIVMGALAVAGLALGGIAYASIPDSEDEIHGCYGKSNGQLRVIDDEQAACKNNETALNWNTHGQQGLPGQDGEDGENGAPGPSGVSHAYHLSSPGSSLAEGGFSATLDHLPAGHYVVFAKVLAAKSHGVTPVTCQLLAVPSAVPLVDLSQAVSPVDGVFIVSIALQGQVDLSNEGFVRLVCGSSDSTSRVSDVQVDAIAVDAMN